jgi:hypothetical protein
MSLEIHALSDRKLASIADWQQAIEAEGFGLQLSAARAFEDLKGFLPAQSGGTKTGFECYHDDARELLVEYDGIDFGREWKFALSFRWGGNLVACLAAYMAATAYAKATDGVVFDTEEGQILTPQQATEYARQMERDLPGCRRSSIACGGGAMSRSHERTLDVGRGIPGLGRSAAGTVGAL